MNFPYVRRSHKWLNIPDEESAPYLMYDTEATAAVVQPLIEQLQANGQWDFWQSWFANFLPVIMDMQRRGMGHVNEVTRSQLAKDLRAELREVDEEIAAGCPLWDDLAAELAEYEANPKLTKAGVPSKTWEKGLAKRRKDNRKRRAKFANSKKDLTWYLFDHLGIRPAPPAPRLKRPARSTSQAALIYVLRHLRKSEEQYAPILHNLFHRSRIATILDRYMNPPIRPTDGRLMPTYKAIGTKTLRLALADPPLHQWVREIRPMVMPAPGCVFLGRDYSQIEARILAYQSGDTPTIEAFEAGRNVHVQNACDLFGYSYPDFAARKDDHDPMALAEYDYAKRYLYELSYGGKGGGDNEKLFCPCYRCAAKQTEPLQLTRAQIRAASARWEAAHYRIMEWRERLYQSVMDNGRVWESPFGYRRYFLGGGDELRREIYNFPMQHIAAMIINAAMVRLHRKGIPLALQMHDELIVEAPVELAADWDHQIQTEMERPVPELGGLVFPTSGSGPVANWGECK